MDPGNKWWKREKLPFTIISSDSLGSCLLQVLSSLEVSVPEWGALLPGAITNILLNGNLRLPTGHFGLLMVLSQQTKKGTTVL